MKIRNVAIALLVVALLFFIPITRQAILFVLPLGRGIDDLIVWGTLLSAAGGLITDKILRMQYSRQRQRALFLFILTATLVLGGLIAWLVIPTTGGSSC